jgi:hypothetical protein
MEVEVKSYMLSFTDGNVTESEKIPFKAPDVGEALVFAHTASADRPAELWDENGRLCTLRRAYVVGPSGA